MTESNNTFNEENIEKMINEGIKKLENLDCNHKNKKNFKCHAHSGAAGTIWFLGFLGAAIYYLQQASTFSQGIIGLLKALLWPGFLVYNLLEFLKM